MTVPGITVPPDSMAPSWIGLPVTLETVSVTPLIDALMVVPLVVPSGFSIA